MKNKKGQSMLEYALLLGVIIAAVLIMQVFIKRGFQGGLKDSADKMGDTFSVSSTSIAQNRIMSTDQKITEEVGTDADPDTGIGAYVPGLEGTYSKGVYSLSQRSGGESTTQLTQKTDSANQEAFRWNEYQTTTYTDAVPGEEDPG